MGNQEGGALGSPVPPLQGEFAPGNHAIDSKNRPILLAELERRYRDKSRLSLRERRVLNLFPGSCQASPIVCRQRVSTEPGLARAALDFHAGLV